MFICVTSVAHLRLGATVAKSRPIWSYLANLSFIGAVTHLANLTFKPHLYHDAPHGLMVYGIATIAHLRSYPPVSIASFMLMENISNLFLFRGIFVSNFQVFKMIIKHRTSHLP